MKKNTRKLQALIIVLISIIHLSLKAQENNIPKYEMRAVWIASVANIDWPTEKGLSARQQQNEYVDLLDSLASINVNAVIVQIRPQGDAFYISSLEPWSEFISGKQGMPPGDKMYTYDPLQFMIEQAHIRGIEFHAWLNPYRISIYENVEEKLDSNHIYFKHPEWFVKYGKRYYFNPGVKESEKFVIEVIKEIVKNYDVDAIHFDDYFYPYQIKDVAFPDSIQYAKYISKFDEEEKDTKNKKLSIDDWRRNNVNHMVENIYKTIKSIKPWVNFGISPFGVWRNKSADPKGSETKAGQTNYDNLYADVLLWMDKGWVDYITPQIYWRIADNAPAPFDVLIKWWSDACKGNTKLYIGQGTYKLDENSKHEFWKTTEGYSKQINMIRNYDNIEGSMHFSAKYFKANLLNINDKLSTHEYRKPAIIPPYENVLINSAKIGDITAKGSSKCGVEIYWKDLNDNKIRYYLIYRFDGEEVGSTENANNILAKVPVKYASKQKFIDRTVKNKDIYTYVVTSVDRFNVESKLSKPITIKVTKKKLKYIQNKK